MPDWPGDGALHVYVVACPNDACCWDVQVRVGDLDDGIQVTCPHCDCAFQLHFPRTAE